MAGVTVPLDEEEDEILRLFMSVCGETTKPLALKKLVREAKKLPCIKKMLEAKKEYSKK